MVEGSNNFCTSEVLGKAHAVDSFQIHPGIHLNIAINLTFFRMSLLYLPATINLERSARFHTSPYSKPSARRSKEARSSIDTFFSAVVL